jgi:hypothetical protein
MWLTAGKALLLVEEDLLLLMVALMLLCLEILAKLEWVAKCPKKVENTPGANLKVQLLLKKD